MPEQSTATSAIRLVMVDDHPLVLRALDSLFAEHDDLEVMARCTNGAEALEAVREHNPDIVIFDLRMPGLDGVGLARELARSGSRSKAIVLAAEVSDTELAELIRLKTRGVVLKDQASETIVDCIRAVMRGRMWVEPDAFRRAARIMAQGAPSLESLTSREAAVVNLIAQGLPTCEVAGRLGVAEGTVKTHLHHIYSKLQVHGRLQLYRFAHEHELA